MSSASIDTDSDIWIGIVEAADLLGVGTSHMASLDGVLVPSKTPLGSGAKCARSYRRSAVLELAERRAEAARVLAAKRSALADSAACPARKRGSK